MGLFDSLADSFRSRLLQFLVPGMLEDPAKYQRVNRLLQLRDYASGFHPRLLKTKPGQFDDNLALNFVGLIAKRAVSMLVGGGVEFDLQGEDITPQDEHLAKVWDENKKSLLLNRIVHLGAILGTCAVKLVPDGLVSAVDGELYPRIVALDPTWLTIRTDPHDVDRVIGYTIEYVVPDHTSRSGVRGFRETTDLMRGPVPEGETGVTGETFWIVRTFELAENGRWELQGEDTTWPYEFAPILTWQNLPRMGSPYGVADIEDVLPLQDRLNFVASNISKIIRYYAHPMRYVKGVGQAGEGTLNIGPDEMPRFGGDQAAIEQLEMQGDLGSSVNYLLMLRQSLFDISQTVDLTSVADKVGALTNFGLRVLYLDSLSKLGMKRDLYGEALRDLNHRLLVLAGFDGEDADGGEIIWPDAVLPQNDKEVLEVLEKEHDLGVTSIQTIAQERGRDFEEETERIAQEKQGEENLGNVLLRAFQRGQQGTGE
jgi:hypothetical protein